MPGANIICLRAPVQVMLSPLGQPQLRLFLFFPKALSIASFLQRKCINSYGQILLRQRSIQLNQQFDEVSSVCQALYQFYTLGSQTWKQTVPQLSELTSQQGFKKTCCGGKNGEGKETSWNGYGLSSILKEKQCISGWIIRETTFHAKICRQQVQGRFRGEGVRDLKRVQGREAFC